MQGPLIAVAIRLLGASDAVAANARLYSHIRIWSAPAALTNFVLLGYLLGRQRARTALAWQAALNVVNVCGAVPGVAVALGCRRHRHSDRVGRVGRLPLGISPRARCGAAFLTSIR